MTGRECAIEHYEGYNDGFYWDYRVWFEYKGEKFTYIDMGSLSGWIPCYESITFGYLDLPKGKRKAYGWKSDLRCSENEFMKLADELIESGEKMLVFQDEEEV